MRALFLALGLFSLAACGASTEEKCQSSCDNTCADQTPPTADEITQCKAACTQVAAYVKRANCESKASALQDCGDAHACDATVNTECRNQSTALAQCLASFCQAHPSDVDCAN